MSDWQDCAVLEKKFPEDGKGASEEQMAWYKENCGNHILSSVPLCVYNFCICCQESDEMGRNIICSF